jgi:hypothetical protein
MARSQLTVTEVVRAGVTQPAVQNSDPTNDHYIESTDADDTWWIEANNTSGTTRTITVTANPSLSSDGLTVSDYSNTITTGVVELMGPFKLGTFKQTADSNRVYVNVDGSAADVLFRVYKITPVT